MFSCSCSWFIAVDFNFNNLEYPYSNYFPSVCPKFSIIDLNYGMQIELRDSSSDSASGLIRGTSEYQLVLGFGSEPQGAGGRKTLSDSVYVLELLKSRGCKINDTGCEEMALTAVSAAVAVTATISYNEIDDLERIQWKFPKTNA